MVECLPDKFQRHIQENELFQSSDRLVIAVSGGADSIALLRLIMELRSDKDSIVVAHLHHGLREESDEEYCFVEELAHQYGISFQGKKICLLDDGSTRLEERARDARYGFLHQVAKNFSAKFVVTAHHADDQVETTLHHFLLGSGIAGLGAIPTVRPIVDYQEDICLVRPLLPFGKEELVSFLQEQKQTWYEDASNQDTNFTRNKIRHEIIPFLESQGFSSVRSAIIRTANHCREAQEYFEQETARILKQNEPTLPVERFYLSVTNTPCFFRLPESLILSHIFLLPTIVRYISRFLQEDISWRYHHYEMLKRIILEKKGSFYLRQGAQVFYHGKNLYFLLRALPSFANAPLVIGQPGEYLLGPETKIQVDEKPQEVFLEVGLPNNVSFPLTIRTWEQGDRLDSDKQPKVSHLLSKARVPKVLREQILVVLDSQNNIIWLPGFYFSEKYHTKSPKLFIRVRSSE